MPTPSDFSNHWKSVLSVPGRQGVDVVASLDETTVNAFLASHFQYDNDRYKLGLRQVFDDHGTERVFTLAVEARTPFRVILPPFWPLGADARIKRDFYEAKTGWVKTGLDAALLPFVARQREEKDPSNIFLGCAELIFTLTWPKLDGGDPWKFTLGPLAVGAKAILSLERSVEPENPPRDVTFLRITPTAVRFDVSPQKLVERTFRSLHSHKSSEVRAIVDDQGFRDLLVIALNVACTTYAPKMVQDVKLPAPVLLNQTITVSMVDVSQKMLTVGATIDHQTFARQQQAELRSKIKELETTLASDIRDIGGLDALAEKSTREPQRSAFKSLLRRLPRTSALMRSLEPVATSRPGTRRRKNLATDPGCAIGINGYLLTALVRDILPTPVSDCTAWWEPPVLPVRGRICWWSRLHDPSVQITDASGAPRVDGGFAVDVGGAIEACVKRFWDCSWRWECGRATLSLNGPFGIALTLKDSSRGVAFSGRISRVPGVETNLPFPFDVVVEGIGNLVVNLIVAFINLVLSQLTIVIVPPEIAFPGQQTGLRLEDFAAFYFKRSSTGMPPSTPESKFAFAAYSCAVTPKKLKNPASLVSGRVFSSFGTESDCSCH